MAAVANAIIPTNQTLRRSPRKPKTAAASLDLKPSKLQLSSSESGSGSESVVAPTESQEVRRSLKKPKTAASESSPKKPKTATSFDQKQKKLQASNQMSDGVTTSLILTLVFIPLATVATNEEG